MEIIVAALAEAIFSVLISDLYQRDSFANLREKLQGGSKEKGALQDALTKALERFKERFPELEAAFFDEHFLLSNGGVAAELAKLLTPNLSPEPETLARLWRAQFSTLQSDELLGPVSSFLEYLRDEINSQPSLKPFIDSRALYQLHKIADHGEQQVMLLGEMVETFSHVRDAMSNLSRQADPVTLPTTALGATPSLTSLSDTQTNSDSTQSLSEDFSFPSPQYFVGRNSQLAELEHALKQFNTVAIGGLPGIGKTTLVARYLEQASSPVAVLWIDLRHYGQIERLLLRVGDYLQVQLHDTRLRSTLQNPRIEFPQKLDTCVSCLEAHKVLLIWDNFDAVANKSLLPLLEQCNSTCRNARILIVSREVLSIQELPNPVYSIGLNGLSPEDGLSLMQHFITLFRLPHPSDNLLVRAYDRVEGHPFFLRLVIIQMEMYPLDALLDTLPTIRKAAQEYLQTQVFMTLDGAAQALLKRLSLFRAPFQISCLRFLANELENEDPFAHRLKKYLVTRQNTDNYYYEIHDLVREYCLLQMSAEQKLEVHEEISAYYRALPELTLLELRELFHHEVESRKLDNASETAERLLAAIQFHGGFDELIEVATEIIEDGHLENLGTIYFIRGRALRIKERFAEAIESYEMAESQSTDIRIIESSKYEQASTLLKLAGRNPASNQSVRDKALRFYEELTLSDDPETRLSSQGALALVTASSNPAEAITRIQDLIPFAKETGNTRLLAQTYQAIGIVAAQQHDFKNAIPALESAL